MRHEIYSVEIRIRVLSNTDSRHSFTEVITNEIMSSLLWRLTAAHHENIIYSMAVFAIPATSTPLYKHPAKNTAV